jgi:Fe2+ transport system protein FeoA
MTIPESTTTLDRVPVGARVKVVRVEDNEMGDRLLAMGLTPEIPVEVLFTAPGGCPVAILINEDYTLGVRLSEIKFITVYLYK